MKTKDGINLEEIAKSIVGLFPNLDFLEQRLSLELYRLIAKGEPVSRSTLALRLGAPVETVSHILDRWPGVFSDAEQRVIGYWGLALPTAYKSPHRFTVDGRTLSAWCAWDTLFLPQLLGRTAEVESSSPASGVTVRLTVTPKSVEYLDPADAQMSFLLPDATSIQKDIVTAFCHFVYFFPSRQDGEAWVEQHPGTFLMSIDEAQVLARLKNEAHYRAVLR